MLLGGRVVVLNVFLLLSNRVAVPSVISRSGGRVVVLGSILCWVVVLLLRVGLCCCSECVFVVA